MKRIIKNVKKEAKKVVEVVNKELRELDKKMGNPLHLKSSIPEKKEEAQVRFELKEESLEEENDIDLEQAIKLSLEESKVSEFEIIENAEDENDIEIEQAIRLSLEKNRLAEFEIIENAEDENDIEIEQAIKLSLEENRSSEFEIIENTNQTEFTQQNNQGQKLDAVTEEFIDIIYNNTASLRLKEVLNPLREAFGLKKLESNLNLIDLELFQTILKNGSVLSAKILQEIFESKEDFAQKFEADLVNHIVSSALYKSNMMGKLNAVILNPVIERINEINKLKDAKALEIKLLTENRDQNTIDMDIFNFALNSKFCEEFLKIIAGVQVADLVHNQGYHLVGSMVDTNHSQVNQTDYKYIDCDIISEETIENLGETNENTEKNDYLG